MAFQFCTNDFYLYAETEPADPGQTETTVETGTEEMTDTSDSGEASTDTTTPPEETPDPAPAPNPEQPATPQEEQREVAGILELEFKDEEGNALKSVDSIALTDKYVGDTIRLTDLGVDTNVADYTLIDIKDSNDSTKDYNQNSVDFVLTMNVTKLQLVYRANPKDQETPPDENNATTDDSQQGEEESEEAGSATEEELIKEEETEESLDEEFSQKPQNISLSVLLAELTRSDNIPITMVGDDGSTSKGSFEGGAISESTAPEWEGYTFTNATVTVNDIPYEINYLVEYKGGYYYATQDNVNVATRLDNIDGLVFHYEKNVTRYDVKYNVTGASAVEGNSFEGVTEVKEGSNLSFSVNTAIGYDAEVMVNGETPSVKEENYGLTKVYTVTNIQNDVNVEINFKELTEFNIDLSWKQTQEGIQHLHEGDVTSLNGDSFSKGEMVTWTIESDDLTWMLNGLSINGENINIPTDFSEGNSATTVLTQGKNSGIVVTVTCNGEQEEGHYVDLPWPFEDKWVVDREYYTHTVTIENAQTDLELTYANLRGHKHKEVMPLDITGVTLYAETTSGVKNLETATPQEQDIFSDPMKFSFTLNPGYSNPVVKVNGQEKIPVRQSDGSYSFTAEKDRNVVTVSVVATKAEYRVKYDLKGGDDSNTFVDNNFYNVDQPTILVNSNIPTKDKQYFAGWKIKGDESNKTYQPGDTVSIQNLAIDGNEIIFEAQWENEATYGSWVDYKVEYQYQTGIDQYNTDETKTETYSGIFGTTVAMFEAKPAIVVEGVTYYLDSDSELVGEITGTNQTVISLKYNRKFSVSYNTNGGTFNSGKSYTSEEVAGDLVRIISEEPIKKGYTFTGWQSEENIQDNTFTMPFKDVTLIAKWEKDNSQWYDLIYDANGGIGGPGAEKEAYLHGAKANLNLSNNPTLEKAKFLGWSENQINEILTTAPEEGTIVKEVIFGKSDKTVYAVWAQDEDGDEIPDYEETKYTLTYDGNGNTAGEAPDAEQHVEKAAVTLAGQGSLARTKAKFLGWSQKQTGLITSQDEAEAANIITNLTMPAEDTKVYAVWVSDIDEDEIPDYEEDKYDLIYDFNGGQDGPETVEDAYINKQTVVLDSSTIPEMEGATFLGWSENQINEILTTAPEEGTIVTEVIFGESDKTVYAVWAVDNNDNNKPDYTESYSLMIKYVYAEDEEGDADLLPEAYSETEMKVGQAYNVKSPAVEGYVAKPAAVTGTIADANVNATVTYYLDSNGNGDPDQDENWFTVRFLDYDGTVLSIQSVLEGMSAVAPNNPTRDGYIFTGWDKSFNVISSNIDIIAIYQSIPTPVTPEEPDTPTPTPGGVDGDVTTTSEISATTTDDEEPTEEPEVEEVEDEETPLSDGDVEDVEDNATPKGNNGIWALINLIAAIVTVILGLILLLSKRHRNDEEEDEEERQARMARGEEKEQEQKRGWICKVLGVIVAIASVVFFILTEDMSLPMALTDKWTIWMIVIAIVELVLVLVGRHWKDVDDEDQEQQA